ncbi:MAG TPA: hypothetical protein PKD20_01590 [Candidatus Saccharibacteria bacterium]|jgi:hypothetical protein|nr:hypothetical protein [Candidatus Saccharibacteria bacterium]HMT55551.1 hypothetical protein [Candidatus Saccharibacteria bacterium]
MIQETHYGASSDVIRIHQMLDAVRPVNASENAHTSSGLLHMNSEVKPEEYYDMSLFTADPQKREIGRKLGLLTNSATIETTLNTTLMGAHESINPFSNPPGVQEIKQYQRAFSTETTNIRAKKMPNDVSVKSRVDVTAQHSRIHKQGRDRITEGSASITESNAVNVPDFDRRAMRHPKVTREVSYGSDGHITVTQKRGNGDRKRVWTTRSDDSKQRQIARSVADAVELRAATDLRTRRNKAVSDISPRELGIALAKAKRK